MFDLPPCYDRQMKNNEESWIETVDGDDSRISFSDIRRSMQPMDPVQS